ncbi:MAG: hypothetical protein RJQ08_02555 [Salinisphaeraceae bacterium]|uniref:Uncharacterized protein n=1 Tax=Spectribacter hydrogenoxidans TaxID=3075608 RepID=A0ABU3C2F7_9GAMM|nr:hypothetical protein [Salinisphaera sp. W335]MDT0635746.1 hypothetical protein [Salinisphaera sp. W335]
MKHAHKLVPIALATALLALSACGSDTHSAQGEDLGHDHAEGSSHEPHGEQQTAPETKAYYGDEESPASAQQDKDPSADTAAETPSDHAHDDDHGHSH